ncbi:AP-3 complex subunit beta-2 [Leptonychotes weddellii]|uniref:AP-3 complex subunit beta-2 n=1 Tax=Leptonychotes weddellii TaxID=9713 RepID=A0A7F8RH90_LEPWE|nr:AP-3 complex subunit beta-2 [Leptonychotes weddellii]
MSAAPAYGEDKGGSAGPGEPEYGHDPASGGIFSSDYKRHDDLKEMLDTNKDSLKLEAMKRIVAMIARGKNASDLFPAVVKNVACKNIEVKKLVYVYLVRYAEEQQDLALLSISTFQRGLKVRGRSLPPWRPGLVDAGLEPQAQGEAGAWGNSLEARSYLPSVGRVRIREEHQRDPQRVEASSEGA